ncbi:hypothetical protein OE88DRAFT_766340 [Heliocybe sulcata]|uniref:Uncharacterized protein n=1 Tax=Heliocybe sulcata TaxID=5364 RepID=A0A5C3N1C2_9AGAM|nr:hypothetical protein OE88DRAFT_766340 [Heliocybe sulcata]
MHSRRVKESGGRKPDIKPRHVEVFFQFIYIVTVSSKTATLGFVLYGWDTSFARISNVYIASMLAEYRARCFLVNMSYLT